MILRQKRKNMITKNEPFTCLVCKIKNPRGLKTPRNHCWNCLASWHVDDAIPGDRLSLCSSVMLAVGIIMPLTKNAQIIHKCQRCDQIRKNRVAEDDNKDKIIELSHRVVDEQWL